MPKKPNGLTHSIWSLLDTIIYPVLYFAATPFLIKYMGSVVFGFWMVLSTLTTVLQLLNFNLGYTAMRHIAHERAAGSQGLVTDIINSLLKITFLQFVGVSAIGGILALILSVTGWMGDYAVHFRYGALCFLLASVMAGLKYFEQLFQNIIKSYDHFRSASIMNTLYRAGTLTVTLLVATFFHQMILYVILGNVLLTIIYLTIYYVYIHKVLPFYKAGRVQQHGLQKRLLSYSIWPWIQSIIVILTFQADRFWISGYAGLKEVSAYALVATMFNHIHMIFMAMVGWVFPRIIGMHAKDEDPEVLYTFIKSLLTVITICSLLVFYWASPILFKAWLGAETYGHMKSYIQGFTGFEIAFVHTIMPLYYLNATGKERGATYITILSCAACYVLMLGGLWLFHSPQAFVIGMTIGTALTIPVYNIATDRSLTRKKRDWLMLGEMIPVFAAAALIFTTSPWLIAGLVIVGGWGLWQFYLIHLINRNVWKQVLNA